MTAPYRPAPCPSCDALRAEVAALRAAPERAAMRLVLRPGGRWLALANACNTFVVVLDCFDGSRGPWRVARAVWCALMWAAWWWAFARRVPADGGGR